MHIERTRAWMDARQNCGLTLGAQPQISGVIYGSGIVEGCTKRPQSRDIRIRHGQVIRKADGLCC
jgi:hypothetical protein